MIFLFIFLFIFLIIFLYYFPRYLALVVVVAYSIGFPAEITILFSVSSSWTTAVDRLPQGTPNLELLDHTSTALPTVETLPEGNIPRYQRVGAMEMQVSPTGALAAVLDTRGNIHIYALPSLKHTGKMLTQDAVATALGMPLSKPTGTTLGASTIDGTAGKALAGAPSRVGGAWPHHVRAVCSIAWWCDGARTAAGGDAEAPGEATAPQDALAVAHVGGAVGVVRVSDGTSRLGRHPELFSPGAVMVAAMRGRERLPGLHVLDVTTDFLRGPAGSTRTEDTDTATGLGRVWHMLPWAGGSSAVVQATKYPRATFRNHRHTYNLTSTWYINCVVLSYFAVLDVALC